MQHIFLAIRDGYLYVGYSKLVFAAPDRDSV